MRPQSIFKSLLSLCAAFLLLISCGEDLIDPVVDPVNPDSRYVTIPVSLKLSAAQTKVSLNGSKYQLEEGDVLYFQNTDKEVTGYAAYSSSSQTWTGRLKYPKMYDFDTEIKTAVLTGRLVCQNSSLYAYENDGDLNHVFPTALLAPDYSGAIAAHLAEAVQRFSCFSTSFTYAEAAAAQSHTIAIAQESAFCDFKVTFDGYLGTMRTGFTPVTFITSDGVGALSLAGYANIEKENDTYFATFTAALPGGTQLSNASFTICDRQQSITDQTLSRNNIYHVSRKFDMSPHVGDPYWSDGSYGAIEHQDQNARIVGIIVYVDQPGVADDGITAKQYGFGHALVMSLHNANNTGVFWGVPGILRTKPATAKTGDAVASQDGYGKTIQWLQGLGETDVKAAYVARHYRADGENLDIPAGSTGWFLASTGQWIYSICDPGFLRASSYTGWYDGNDNLWYNSGNNYLSSSLAKVMKGETALTDLFNTRFEELRQHFAPTINEYTFYDHFGMLSGGNRSDNYWTSDEFDKDKAIRMNYGAVATAKDGIWSSIKLDPINKYQTYGWKEAFYMKVRPFLAF